MEKVLLGTRENFPSIRQVFFHHHVRSFLSPCKNFPIIKLNILIFLRLVFSSTLNNFLYNNIELIQDIQKPFSDTFECIYQHTYDLSPHCSRTFPEKLKECTINLEAFFLYDQRKFISIRKNILWDSDNPLTEYGKSFHCDRRFFSIKDVLLHHRRWTFPSLSTWLFFPYNKGDFTHHGEDMFNHNGKTVPEPWKKCC
jgi:hypothetical protein